jgi:cytoskeleton protein RodZ
MMSTVPRLPDGMPAAERSGADLRAARERLGWSLPDVAAGLRIRLSHLEALEEGHIALLPGHAYAVGFVRSYASILGLDAEEIVRRFKTEAAGIGRRTELVFPTPVPDRGLPAGAVMLLGLVLAVGAYVGWYRLSGEGRLPAETVTAIPERLAPLAQQALPPVVVTQAAPPTAAAPQVAQSDPAPAVPAISPTSAAAALVHEPVADAAPAAAPAPAVPVPALDGGRIMLRANADAWVQVKDRSGTVLLNKVLKPGDTWQVPRQDNLLLTTGNAGGMEVLVDGVTTPALGASGAVRRDLPLDPDQIKDGKWAVTVQTSVPRGRQ